MEYAPVLSIGAESVCYTCTYSNEVITGHQAGSMFGDMEPAFLRAGKQAYLMSKRRSAYGSTRERVQSKSFVHQCAAIIAVESPSFVTTEKTRSP